MTGVVIVAIVFGSIVTIAGLICGTVLVIMKMRQSSRSATDKKSEKEEAVIIQEIYRGLERMEDRIEALETILMEGQTKYGDKK